LDFLDYFSDFSDFFGFLFSNTEIMATIYTRMKTKIEFFDCIIIIISIADAVCCYVAISLKNIADVRFCSSFHS
jgi:hypothetical protein